MLDRRKFLATTAMAAVLAPQVQAADASLNTLFDALYLEDIRSSPEQATRLGLDTGANTNLRAKLDDNSSAGIAADKARTTDQLRRLQAFNASGLAGADRVNYDTVVYTKQSRSRLQAFDFGGASGVGPSPYVISQQSGSYQEVPNFLDTKHPIANAQDADAYLARLEAFAGQLDNDTERFGHDTALGLVPPDFLLDLALGQLNKVRVPVEESVLVTSIARRAKARGLPDSYGERAASLYTGKIAPALDRQIAAVTKQRATAGHDSSMRAFKDGPAYYAASLHSYTTTNLTPQEVHNLGLEQARAISARLDQELKKQGYSKGTVGVRMSALSADPRYLYPNTDAAKADIIAFCNDRLAAMRPKLPTMFKRLPPYAFEVRREPAATEQGAAAAHSDRWLAPGHRLFQSARHGRMALV
jgi:uncharacterized protein (DUF885 family)